MSLDGLSLEAQQALDNYLLRLSNHLHIALMEVRDSVLSTIESQLQAQLKEYANHPEQFRQMVNSLDAPELEATRVSNWLWLIYSQQEAAEVLKLQKCLQSG